MVARFEQKKSRRRSEDDSSLELSVFNMLSLEIYIFLFLSNFDLTLNENKEC